MTELKSEILDVQNKKSATKEWCLVIIGVLFFSLSHPGLFNNQGISLFAYICLVPVFLSIKNSKVKLAWAYGFLYGALSYGLYCFWLFKFCKIVFFSVILIYGIYLSIVFLLMKSIFILFSDNKFTKNNSHLIQYFLCGLIWCVYEYLKTLGFLGFSYGILGYTQYKAPLLLQSASIGGVWAVSAFCVFCNVMILFLSEILLSKFTEDKKNKISFIVKSISLFALVILVFLTYGFVSIEKTKSGAYKKIKIICVQNSTDPWKTGVEFYKKDVQKLKSLTDNCLEKNPDAKIVVWPETSVVPPIVYNYEKRKDAARYEMILDLLNYFNSKDCAFVIGNQHSEQNGKKYTDDYNSALLFNKEKNNIAPPNPDVYRKIHLVPFTEYFPYEKAFPKLYKMLLNGDTHLWSPGKEYYVFKSNDIKFSTPICFEDTFGNLCRQFVKNKNEEGGAELFINISNDAWSKSESCQEQHLSMAVLRSVENKVPTARSTSSGTTCFIDSNGKIILKAKSFCEEAICSEVHISSNKKNTFYTNHGDWLPIVEMMILIICVVILLVKRVVARKSKNGVE